MITRPKIPEAIQTEVLVKSRRRCCICYGLKRDDEVKKGQIAHLDHNRTNNNATNLAFLCLNHHDEYDGKTSQAKKITKSEVEHFRDELYSIYGSWIPTENRDYLLNFLAFMIDLEAMADAAIKVGSQLLFYGAEHALNVLITDEIDSCDGDRYFPHLIALDHFASWGWLNFTEEEKEDEVGLIRVYIKAKRKPICDKVAEIIIKRIQSDGDKYNMLDHLLQSRGWKGSQ